MARPNGGIIGPDNVPTPFTAKGTWKLSDAFNYIKAGLWPPTLGYQVNNSLRFNSGSSDNLTRTPASSGNRRTYTISYWIKRSKITYNYDMNIGTAYSAGAGNSFQILYDNTDKLNIQAGDGSWQLISTQLFRDVSAWYHIVVAIDTTQATSSNRIKMYVNGSQVTSFSTATYPTQNLDTAWNNTIAQYVGDFNGAYSMNGYMAEVYNIDGQALTPSSFGQTDSATGIWTPIAYTGTYGTNGFYLKFANSASLGTDSSGNGNNFTVNNLTSVDQSTDTPTNNFCTLNYIQNGNGTTVTLSEGNLVSGSGDNKGCSANFGVNRGKWYWEVKTVGSTYSQRVGVSNRANEQDGDASPGTDTANVRSWCGAGAYKNYSASSSSADAAFVNTSGAIYAFGLDLDNGTLRRYVNGSLVNTDTTLPSDNSVTFFPFTFFTFSNVGGWNQAQFNFGSPMYSANSYADANGFGNFSYAVPSGYYSLCTKNLAIYG